MTAEAFANPPMGVRPMYRYWMPLAYTDDEVLRAELRDMAASGAGGVEIAPFVVPGAGNQTNSFLEQYGWGTPEWAHKMEVITAEAAELGLVVDQNLGPQYPPTVPTLNSFNQREAEQQLIFGREFNPAGSSRTGALPAPTVAPPNVTTQLCGAAAPGDEMLKVQSLGGYAPGDSVTVGTGADAERVVVSGLGDRTAECGDLSTSPIKNAHAVSEPVVTVARATRLRTLVAQCATACTASDAAPVQLVPSSVLDVTAQVSAGKLDYTFPSGNGNPWVVIDFTQTASGLVAQRNGYTATQPNYVPDHWNRGGVQIQTNFWDEHILTPTVRANLRKIGGGAIFEDSLELGETQKWTWGFLQQFEKRRGYDPTTLLPALAGAGIQGSGTPAFKLAGVDAQIREDYRQTLSDLYIERYVAPMQEWAEGHGLNYRAQSYGVPISTGAAGGAAGIPEGESLNFAGPTNTVGPEQSHRAVAAGAHLTGKNIVSVECCAVFQGGYRSSLAGPSVGGQFGQGGDGTQVGGKYSQGLLDSIYKSYAGGVNQLVWHGYAYRDAPVGVGSSGRDGSWPGYHPWDIFGVISVNDEFGPRQASWPDYKPVNESLARDQLVLRQGRATLDLGVYYEDLGLAGASAGTQQPVQHMLGNDSATSRAGYTYEYVAPDYLTDPDLQVEADGGLFADTSDHEALVLNNQTTMSVANAKRLRDLAEDGLRIFIVGSAPSTTTGAAPGGAGLAGVVADLMAQPTVVHVPNEADMPTALAAAGIRPTVIPEEPTAALGLVRRDGDGVSYDFVYNRSSETLAQELTLTGTGRPYLMDTWTGKITAIAEYTTGNGTVRVPVEVAPHDKVVIALVAAADEPVPAPGVHALSSTGDVLAMGDALTLRAGADGQYVTKLSNGDTRTTEVSGLPSGQRIDTWTLQAQTWTPGDKQWTTVKTDQPEVAVTAGEDGALPSWRDITGPVDLSQSSGIGAYTATIELADTWQPITDGAYLALGAVLDSASVTVNGAPVTVNQADRNRIDLGKNLRPGTNTIVVRVATTMFNAVRKSGDSNYQLPAWQEAGLQGPVVLSPYRDTAIPVTATPSTPPTKKATSTKLKVKPTRLTAGKRAVAMVTVSAKAEGKVRIRVDGKVVRTMETSQGKARIRLPKLHVGKHRVRAEFLGTTSLKPSKSPRVKVTVVRKGR
ncbi:glycosyl hydrolase [Nocardioides dongkuii]|uniref:glycosyl hydrolase n=1 Tax=Nocardioides dongkuii TaxID=2760089 RepID=UPI0015FD2E4A|nr:glycosyl hydrolase [Nocardioides dongkuii]